MSAVLLPKNPNGIKHSSPFSCTLVRIRSLLTDIERLARKNLELEDDRRFQCNVRGRSQARGRLSIMCSGTDHIAVLPPHTGILRGPRTVAHDPAHLISGAVEQFEKRKAVSGGAVADAATFLQRTGPPDRLTRRSQEVVKSRAWKVCHGVHNARRTMAVLHQHCSAPRSMLANGLRPIDQPVVANNCSRSVRSMQSSHCFCSFSGKRCRPRNAGRALPAKP